jgi:hypothetical protein
MDPSIFPLIDILRLLALNPISAAHFMDETSYQPSTIISLFTKLEAHGLAVVSEPVLLMTLRLACNAFSHCKSLLLSSTLLINGNVTYRSMTTALAIEALLSPNPKIKHVAASLIYNIAVNVGEDKSELGVEWACEVLAACTEACKGSDVDVKVVYAIGLVLREFWEDEAVLGLASAMEVREVVGEMGEGVGTEICKLLELGV